MKSQSFILGKWIPLVNVCSEAVFILLEVAPVYEYDSDNKRTDRIAGFAYNVVNTENFERFSVKVAENKPLISATDLKNRREKGEKFYVEFENAEIKAYYSTFKSTYVDTFRADGISFVKEE